MVKKGFKVMKKAFCLVLAILMLCAVILTGCSEKEVGEDIETKAALQAIYDNAKAALGDAVFVPMTLDYEINADTCANYTGLTAEQFAEYVMDGYTLIAAINVQTFDLALVKCKDYAAAKEVKKLIAEGFNPANRVCAIPDQAFVIESGRFVLLGGMSNDTAEAFQKAFTDQFETKAGEVNKFFERGEGDTGGGLGGLDLIPG